MCHGDGVVNAHITGQTFKIKLINIRKVCETMLSKKGVIIRCIICLSCFLLSGTGTITGWMATICGVFGTIELACALLRYSPLCELLANSELKVPKVVMNDNLRYTYPDPKPTLVTPRESHVTN